MSCLKAKAFINILSIYIANIKMPNSSNTSIGHKERGDTITSPKIAGNQIRRNF